MFRDKTTIVKCKYNSILLFLSKPPNGHFYRAMRCSAKRGHAIACRTLRSSISQSVTLVDQDHRLEILETNCTDN